MVDWSLITDKGRHISCHQYIKTIPGVHSTSSKNDLYKWLSIEINSVSETILLADDTSVTILSRNFEDFLQCKI